jgi:hypothetical protein
VANPALPGFTKVDLYFMPYTHSLLGAAWWALAAAVIAVALSPPGRKLIAGAIIALLVVSHWFVDLLVHRNDLALVSDNEHKLGFGLWNEPLIAAPLELGLLLAGFAIYMRATQAKGALGRILPWVVMVILLGAQAFNWMSPPPASNAEFSGMGLLAYGVAALLALSLDLTRSAKA